MLLPDIVYITHYGTAVLKYSYINGLIMTEISKHECKNISDMFDDLDVSDMLLVSVRNYFDPRAYEIYSNLKIMYECMTTGVYNIHDNSGNLIDKPIAKIKNGKFVQIHYEDLQQFLSLCDEFIALVEQ